MGAPFTEVDLLGPGVQGDTPGSGAFALNMIYRHNSWQVREGFGQVAQYDTTMSTNPRITTLGTILDTWGYSRVVGSHLLNTSFGHTQVVTVIEANNSSGNARAATSGYLGQGNWPVSTYCVSIHDLTTNERWEEPVYRHTSEGNRLIVPLHMRLGQYLTCIERDCDEWVAGNETAVWFAEWDGRLLFGNGAMGVMLYSPSTFNGSKRMAVDLVRSEDWSDGYCESACVTRVSPSPGVFAIDGSSTYIGDGDFAPPSAATAYGDRMVYASGRNVFFSDRQFPTSVMSVNVIAVPCDGDITALAVAGETLFAMSATQTWSFRAPPGDFVSEGRGFSIISETVGCVAQSAVSAISGTAVWCDRQGVYASTGQGVEKISQEVDRFFSGFITDPVSKWLPAQGMVGTDSAYGETPERRPVTLRMSNELPSMSYSEELDALFLNVPDENLALCYSGSRWSVWSFTSIAANNAGGAALTDGAVQNIKNPQIVCRDDKVILVGGLDEQQFQDAARYYDSSSGNYTNAADHATSRSYYILEYGRGGAIDRSIDNEDYRVVTGKYVVYEGIAPPSNPIATDTPGDIKGGFVYFDPWIKVAEGYTFPGGVQANSKTYLVPVSIALPKQFGTMPTGATAIDLDTVMVSATFDGSKWEAIYRAGTDIAYLVPSERIASVSGYAGAGAQVTATAAGRLDILWNGVTAAGAWTHKPAMNVNGRRKATLLYIPMRVKSAALSEELSGMAWKPVNTNFSGYAGSLTGGGGLDDLVALGGAYWEQWSVGAPRKEDNVAQPVDWAYKSPEMGAEGSQRMSARGVAAAVLSHGEGTDKLTTWPFGLFNTMVAADGKMTTAQPLDYAGRYSWTGYDPGDAPPGGNKIMRPVSIQTNVYPNPGGFGVVQTTDDTLRHRLISSNNTLHQSTFNHPTAGVAVWGTKASSTVTDGDVIVSDEQLDTIVTSDSLRCSSFSYMLFGFVQNRAETIKLQMAKGLYRPRMGGRVRRGK